jgi:hypothetical protein
MTSEGKYECPPRHWLSRQSIRRSVLNEIMGKSPGIQRRAFSAYTCARSMDTSALGLILSLAIGAVGAGLFIYGKKQQRWPQMTGGIVLCIYPYFVPNLWLMGAIAAVIVAAVWITVRMGN